MLGIVAHDRRNPLSGIRATAQLLLEMPLDQDKWEAMLKTIRDGADIALNMTDDLLDVAAIREGKVELRAVNGRARLAVVDYGQGIPREEIDHIFEPFGRASPRPNAGERSTGLGLAIVKKLAEAHAGEVRVESAPSKGSRCEIFLPFATAFVGAPA